MKNLLAENMRRFKTKNLNEAVALFSGDITTDTQSPEFQSLIVTLDGKKQQLIYNDKQKTAEETAAIAKQEQASLPNRKQLNDLMNLVRPSTGDINIWVDQGVGEQIRYILFNLNDGSDVMTSVNNDTIVSKNDQALNQTFTDKQQPKADYIVLLRNKPMMPTVTVTPK
jgi:hypothetical protein